ncbi:MAG: hypothetical protein QM330_11700 [Acidobacteriota bacterium]|jgi:hypothetical protein|nr:hypothetical protein [Acidobacteriota bacterium]NLT31879.1 hypothetical protein [Acidobacteriota bacterium]
MTEPNTIPYWAQYAAVAAFGLSALACRPGRLKAAGPFFLLAGFLLQSWFLLGLGRLSGMFLPNTIVSLEVFLPWALAALVLLHRAVSDRKETAHTAVILIFAVAILTSLQTRVLAAQGSLVYPPGPMHPVGWVTSFFFTESMAYAAFFLACWFALAHLRRRDTANVFHNFLILSFVLFSLSQVLGAIWSYLGWSVPFHLSSDRHYNSAAFWLFLALYLHLKFLPGWPAPRRARLVAIAFIPVLYFRYLAYFLGKVTS